MINWKSIQYKY